MYLYLCKYALFAPFDFFFGTFVASELLKKERPMLHQDVTEKVINAFYTVNNNLGYGFLERVYENAMVIELSKLGCRVINQQNIKVFANHRKRTHAS